VPAGLVATVLVSLATPRPPAAVQAFVEGLRYPRAEPPAQPATPARREMP
jgi:Na+(H+)/acetate symporter ActP